MMRCTAPVLRRSGIPPFALFLKEKANAPALSGLTGAVKMKAASSLFQKLSPSAKCRLRQRAMATLIVRKPKVSTPKPEKVSRPAREGTFAHFFKTQYPLLQGTAPQRLKKTAELWRQKKSS